MRLGFVLPLLLAAAAALDEKERAASLAPADGKCDGNLTHEEAENVTAHYGNEDEIESNTNKYDEASEEEAEDEEDVEK